MLADTGISYSFGKCQRYANFPLLQMSTVNGLILNNGQNLVSVVCERPLRPYIDKKAGAFDVAKMLHLGRFVVR